MGLEEDAENKRSKSLERTSFKPAKNVTSFRMRPTLAEAFKGNVVKAIIKEVMRDVLQGKTYNVEEVSKWTRHVADTVNMAIKDRLHLPKYKYIVQVMLGQQTGAGCHYFAKCYWDVEADTYISDVFHNPTLFCVCTVFAIYLY